MQSKNKPIRLIFLGKRSNRGGGMAELTEKQTHFCDYYIENPNL